MKLESRLAGLAENTRENFSWRPPIVFDLRSHDNREKLDELAKQNEVQRVVDNKYDIACDIFDMQNPHKGENGEEKASFAINFASSEEGEELTRRIYFPWDKTLITYPEEAMYRELKTFRYRNLLLPEEQAKINMARIAIVGLSVGSNIAEALAENGVGQAMSFYDYDTVGVPNLGRMAATMENVGETKASAVAKRISKIDPYINLTISEHGYNRDDEADLDAFAPTVIFDEVDHMPTAARVRMYAQKRHVPLLSVSDVDDSAVIEVRRHDLGINQQCYSGMVSDKVCSKLADDRIPKEKHDMIFVKSVGSDKLTTRFISSVMEIDKTIGGIPQLGSTALIGAGLAVKAVREISIGNPYPRSGMYTSRGNRVLRCPPRSSPLETLSTLRSFLKREKADTST